MHKATANGGDNKCMNIYEVLKAVGFGNMRTGIGSARSRVVTLKERYINAHNE